MTDNAQQGNNLSASAHGAPKPTGDKPQGTEAGKPSQGAPRADAGRAIGAPRASMGTARAALYGDHPQRSAAARESAREPRGAGSGENANATRGRSIIDWPPEPLSHAEHVEELLEMAQENEDFNAAVNEEQIAVTRDAQRRIGGSTYPLGDPELERQNREETLDAYRRDNDPNDRLERVRGEMDARAARNAKRAKDMYGEEHVTETGDANTRIARTKDAAAARARGAEERAADKVAGAK